MLVFDFFSGTGSSTQAFREAGDTVIGFEIDASFNPEVIADINDLNASELLRTYGRPDFIWASPPCTTFSVASIGHHWVRGGSNPLPKTNEAADALVMVLNLRRLIEELNPKYGFLIENPRGMMRKIAPMQDLDRVTITYCQYGDTRQKPTDLWGWLPNWNPRPTCKPKSDCHESAPRGSRTGTQGLGNAKDRSRIAPELGHELRAALAVELEEDSPR